MGSKDANLYRLHLALGLIAGLTSLAIVIYSSRLASSLFTPQPTVLGATDRPNNLFDALLELFHLWQ